MKRCFATVAVLLVCLLIGTSTLMAQLPTGTILGVVKDSSGAAIPGATVTATNTDTNEARTLTTDTDGSYRFNALQPGPYNVTVTKDGFDKSNLTSLTLEVAQNLEANATLQVGSVQQEVTVNGELAPQVDVTTSALGGLVNSQQIVELPLNGRNFIDLALLQPGVANTTNNGPGLSATWFSSNGAPVRSNNTTLDGAPMMSVKGATASVVGTTLGVDGIQEFRVLTNSFGAQYGISMGSQIVIVSKGGTNQFHGDAFDYLRNNDLDAWGYFALKQPRLLRNNFGGSFGGPIRKNNTFFYAVYEGIRQQQGGTSIVTTLPANCNPNANPGAAGAALLVTNPCAVIPTTNPTGKVNPVIAPFLPFYPIPNVLAVPNEFTFNTVTPTNVDYGQIRVDHTFNAADSMFGRFTIDRAYSNSSASWAGTPYQNVGTLTQGKDIFATVAESHIFSPALLNTARLSYSRTIQNTYAEYPAIFAQPGYNQIYNQAMGSLSITTGLSGIGIGGNVPQQFSQNLYTGSDDIYLTKGRHALQFGVLLNRIEYYTDNSLALRGTTTFSSVANFFNGIYTSFTSLTPLSDTEREPRFYTIGTYVQDDWRVTNRLTLNLGLRYEPDSVAWDRHGANYAFHDVTAQEPVHGPIFRNTSFKDFGPRVGFAWDVRGNGKTAVRAAFGEYFDVNAYGFTFYTTGQGSAPTSAVTTFNAGTISSFPILTAAQNLVPGTMPYGSALHMSNYAVGQPHLLQWNFGISQQLTPSVAISVAYVGTRGIHLWDNQEGNPCLPSSTVNGQPVWTNPLLEAPAGITTVFVPNDPTNPGGPGVNKPNTAGFLPNPLNHNLSTSAVCQTIINPGTSSAHFLQATYPSDGGGSGTGPYLVPSRLNPLWSDWVLASTGADSSYHGAQVTVTKRIANGLQGQVAFTYSKTIDDAQGLFNTTECSGSGGDPIQVIAPFRKEFDRGPSCFDIPKQVQASLLYHFPTTKSFGFVGRELLSGWWVGNKTSWQVGFPFTPTVNNWRSFDQNITSNNIGAGSTDYVDYGTTTVAPGQTGVDGTVNTTNVTFVPYNKNTVIVGTPSEWYNPYMFTMNTLGTLGTAHKNSALRGPHFSDVDLSLNKDTAVPLFGEKGQLEFRVEAFNLFNHTNFALPSGHEFAGNLTDTGIYSEAPTVSSGITQPGRITSIVGNQRLMQLSLKLIF